MEEQNSEAFFFDGTGAQRRNVRLAFQPDGMTILEDGAEIAFWRYADLSYADAPKGVTRLAARNAPELARLEVRDAELAEAIAPRISGLRAQPRSAGGGTLKIVAWSLAAVFSLALCVVFLVPLVADRLAPFVPLAMEKRLGDAVDRNVRAIFGHDVCTSGDGQAALDRMTSRLLATADLDVPVSVAVLPNKIPNAVALPGGRIYVFDGLLKRAESPDELAGVLAHEIGHVENRDGLRKLLQTGGSAFLLGLLFGDVTGGGAIIFASKMLVDSRYSRQAEKAADDYAAALMLAAGRTPRPLGVFLNRLGSGGSDRLAFLSSHPVTEERMAALSDRHREPTGAPFLSTAEWQAVKTICEEEEE